MFCPKCGSILVPKEENKKRVLACSCGYTSDKKAVIKEKIEKNEKEVGVVEEEPATLPKTKAECPKCHHREAFFWEVQTRAADEAATKFLRCIKCRHTWRDYN